MSTNSTPPTDADQLMRSVLQRVATGPELSKEISFDEARAVATLILEGKANPVQAGVFLIALRMKRETDDENRGVLRALIDASTIVSADVDDVVDIADPYDGYTRGLPASPFLPAVLAACGVPAVSHGVESVGPKFGVTHRMVLRAAGVDVDLAPQQAAARLADPKAGWAYVDQRAFCPKLHDLIPLRQLIVKRPCLTTVEVLVGPVRGRRRSHLYTGYVHKPYPRIYALLAREAGFDSAMIVRGVEGGVIPSLQQPSKIYTYHDRGAETERPIDPADVGIEQANRAVPLPDGTPRVKARDEIAVDFDTAALARAAAEAGVGALRGEPGAVRDSLVYAGALALVHLQRADSLDAGAAKVRAVLDNGEALARFKPTPETAARARASST